MAAIKSKWTRYWAERDGSHHIDQYGFLDHYEFYKDSLEFAELREQQCLLLLGEPGIGKSFAIKDAAAQQIEINNSDEKVFFFDLRSYGSEDRLFTALFESPELKLWREGDYRLHLFLDSLDECLLRVDTVAAMLIEEFAKDDFPKERLMLRIACRTADLPPILEKEIFQLWKRDGKKGIYELCPLQRSDAMQAADDTGIDATAFLSSVIDKGVGTLAARPMTLRMLLNLFEKNGEFPKSAVELYELGCRALCDEPNENRRSSARIQSVYSADETLLVGARIAAFCVLCNRGAIWTGIEAGEQRPEDILVREMVGGKEEYRGIATEVNEDAIRGALKTGLFSSRGSYRQGWAHQTFGEFLAAWYLNQKNLSLETILSLISDTANKDSKAPPQMGETLSWLASMRSDVREHLLKTDPILLLKSDSATYTSDFKATLVEELLNLFITEQILDDRDLHNYYSRLAHPALAEQLRPYIVDKQQSHLVRRVATDIAQECKVLSLQNLLADLVLEEREDLYVRINAGYAVWRIADVATREKLRELALHESPNDVDLELKGVALLSVWPDVINADELFAVIQHPPEGFYGAYSLFLSRFASLLQEKDIPRALRWVRESLGSMGGDFAMKRIMNEIIGLAEQHIHLPLVLEEFSKTLAVLLGSYTSREILDLRAIQESGNNSFLATDAKRREVLRALSQHSTDGEKVVDSILYTNFLRPTLNDLPWLLNELENVIDEGSQWFFARLVGAFYGIYSYQPGVLTFQQVVETEPAAFTLLSDANNRNPTVQLFFGTVFKEVELDSEIAKRERAWHETAKKRQMEFEEMRKAPPLLDPLPAQRIEEYLMKLERGELSYFPALSQTLTLEPDSQYYRHWSDPDITEFAGWKSAGITQQSRIIEAAKRYVVGGEPENEKWVGTDSYQYAALAGYHALFLLLKVAPEFVDLISVDIWRKWAPIITLFPLYNEKIELHQLLVEKAYKNAPNVVLTSISKQIELENTNSNVTQALSEKFEKCWDESFRLNLREQITTKSLNPSLRTRIIRELLMHKDVPTEEIALRPFTELLMGKSISPEELESAAITLSQNAMSREWAQVLWKVVSIAPEKGRALVEAISNVGSPANYLVEEDAADFYIWLEEQYPHKEDPPMHRGAFFGIDQRQELGRWRDSFLGSLANRGTVESINALEKIRLRFPELDWLKRYILDAKALTRRTNWNPIEPSKLFEVIGQPQQPTLTTMMRMKLTDDEIDNLTFTGERVGKNVHLSRLLKDFRNLPNSFVFFTGAGLSVPLFPNWKTALESLLEIRYQNKKDDARRNELQQLFNKEQYLEVADMCARDLGEIEYRKFVLSQFDKEFSIDDIPPAYREILELRPQTILSTNYDRIPDVGGEGYHCFSNSEGPQATIAVVQQEPCILKLHGSVTNLDSVIFTATQYQNIYKIAAFKKSLEAILRLKYVVFLGFSFTDPYFMSLLADVYVDNERILIPKYALVEGLSNTEVESKQNLFGLSIIPYSKSDDTHSEVVEFVRLLKTVSGQSHAHN